MLIVEEEEEEEEEEMLFQPGHSPLYLPPSKGRGKKEEGEKSGLIYFSCFCYY